MNTPLKKASILFSLIVMATLSLKCDHKTEPEIIVSTDINQEETDYSIDEDVVLREPVVFITGNDTSSDNYYTNARNYFEQRKVEVVNGKYSLEEIINWLNNNADDLPYGEIHIVNKSNPFKGLTLETVVNGELVTKENLQEINNEGKLPILEDAITSNSKIIFHANGLGNNKELMNVLKNTFSANNSPKVVASAYYSIFNGEFSNHFLAKPYYVFYPTANSPGKVDLSKEIAKKYPNEKDIDWNEAIYNETERFIGEAYYTQQNIPVKFELDYHNSDDEIPTFEIQEEIMDFIEQRTELYAEFQKLNIPLEKFRWSYKLKNSVLTIKGKSTVITILKPLIKQYGELQHIEPDTNNKRLYAMK
jgi:hypothetical protein